MRPTLIDFSRIFLERQVFLFLVCAVTLTNGCETSDEATEAKLTSRPEPTDRRPFCLTTEFFPIPFENRLMRTPLVRELGRQAVLIAARDGLGLPTRDETLGERFPDDAMERAGPFALKVRVYHTGNGSIELSTVSNDASVAVAPYRFHFQGDTYNRYTSLAISLGRESRGELVKVLRRAGCTGQEVEWAPKRPLPKGVESSLAKMNFVDQYAAVRLIHKAVAEDGDSPARLGGLVRGYANLTLLARHHWSSMHAVFAARALLYAERLRTSSDNPRLALQHRAYARALIGLHGIALQDLNRLPTGRPAADESLNDPPWARVVEPFCRFDHDAVLRHAEESDLAELAPRLAFEINACYGDTRWTADSGERTIVLCPEAFGVYAEMADRAPMLTKRKTVQMSMDSFGWRLPRRVARIDGLPENAKGLLKDIRKPRNSRLSRLADGRVASGAFSPLPMQLAQALRDASTLAQQSAEPSWNVLAQLIAEEQFIQAANCLEVSRIGVESSKQQLVERLQPLVDGHTYSAYTSCFAINGPQQPDELARMLTRIRVRDPRGRMQPLFETYRDAMDASGKTFAELSTEALWQREYHLPAIQESLRTVYESWWKAPHLISSFQRMIIDLNAISPYAPAVLRLEINTTNDPSGEQLEEWEQRAQQDPIALRQVAECNNEVGDFEAAIRCYERSYELSPNHRVSIALAEAYRSNGQSEEWRPTLVRYLAVEDYGLGHSVIERHIAEDHLSRCEWAEAEPHALATAKTWSTMGLITASRVYEGLGKWNESERWIREATINYSTYNGMQWYLWCRRTGRGDRAQAKSYADKFLQYSSYAHIQQGVQFPFLNEMFSERYDLALARIIQTSSCDGDLGWQLQAELLAKLLDQDERYARARENATRLLEEQPREIRTQIRAIAAILHPTDAEFNITEQQLSEADKLLEQLPNSECCDYAYYLAEALAYQGDEDRAEAYWRKSLASGQYDRRNATLSGWRLAERHDVSRPDEEDSVEARVPTDTAYAAKDM